MKPLPSETNTYVMGAYLMLQENIFVTKAAVADVALKRFLFLMGQLDMPGDGSLRHNRLDRIKGVDMT